MVWTETNSIPLPTNSLHHLLDLNPSESPFEYGKKGWIYLSYDQTLCQVMRIVSDDIVNTKAVESITQITSIPVVFSRQVSVKKETMQKGRNKWLISLDYGRKVVSVGTKNTVTIPINTWNGVKWNVCTVSFERSCKQKKCNNDIRHYS